MTVTETWREVKSFVEVAAKQNRNLPCIQAALVNLIRRGNSDGWRVESFCS